MRTLLFSDLHAHTYRSYSETLPNGLNSRLNDTILILDQIRSIADDNQVDLILFVGDMFHVRGVINVTTFNRVFDAVARMRLRREVALLPGNHDQINRTGDDHSIHSFESIVGVMDSPGWYTYTPNKSSSQSVRSRSQKLHVLAVPYHPSKDVIRETIADQIRNIPDRLAPVVLLGHFGIDGAEVGSNIVLVDEYNPSVEDLLPSEFDQVFLGHYHTPQQLAENVRYVGAAQQHNWGDEGSERGCWLWDTMEKLSYSTPTFVPLNSPRFVSVGAGEEVEESSIAGNFIRIRLDSGVSRSKADHLVEVATSMGARVVEVTEPTVSEHSHSSSEEFQHGLDIESMLRPYASDMGVGGSEDGEYADLEPDKLVRIGQGLLEEVQ